MKIFIDTNIFLDLILKREYYKEAILIFNAVDKNMFQAIVLDVTLLNIDYVARKQIKDIRNFIKLVNEKFTVVGANNTSFVKALELDNKDLEDNLQYICAEDEKCMLIITNDKSFYKGELKCMGSLEFVNRYLI